MQPFRSVSGAAAPLMQANIDTDVIIRIERLTGGADLGHYALEALRYREDGSPNPDCVLNEPRYLKTPILLAGRNFGCGSSREGAVNALMGMGLRAVIAPSFGDIFYGNCFKNGMLPVVLDEAVVEALAHDTRLGNTQVDLEKRRVVSPAGVVYDFAIDDLNREALLEGLDELGLTLKLDKEIAAWQTADRTRRPWVWLSRRVT